VTNSDDEVEALAAEQALEEMDYYTSSEAEAAPLYDESEAGADEGDEAADWDDGEDDDDDLGEYA
jgi:hypothetical protein